MEHYVLKNKQTGMYLCNGSFCTLNKDEATALKHDEAVKLEKGFNSLFFATVIVKEKA